MGISLQCLHECSAPDVVYVGLTHPGLVHPGLVHPGQIKAVNAVLISNAAVSVLPSDKGNQLSDMWSVPCVPTHRLLPHTLVSKS